MKPKALLSWSTGKDSAHALHEVQRAGQLEVVGLLTTVTAPFGRVSMHGVRESLLDRQLAELGLPCTKIGIPAPCPNEVYEAEMRRLLLTAREQQGVTHDRGRARRATARGPASPRATVGAAWTHRVPLVLGARLAGRIAELLVEQGAHADALLTLHTAPRVREGLAFRRVRGASIQPGQEGWASACDPWSESPASRARHGRSHRASARDARGRIEQPVELALPNPGGRRAKQGVARSTRHGVRPVCDLAEPPSLARDAPHPRPPAPLVGPHGLLEARARGDLYAASRAWFSSELALGACYLEGDPEVSGASRGAGFFVRGRALVHFGLHWAAGVRFAFDRSVVPSENEQAWSDLEVHQLSAALTLRFAPLVSETAELAVVGHAGTSQDSFQATERATRATVSWAGPALMGGGGLDLSLFPSSAYRQLELSLFAEVEAHSGGEASAQPAYRSGGLPHTARTVLRSGAALGYQF